MKLFCLTTRRESVAQVDALGRLRCVACGERVHPVVIRPASARESGRSL